MIRTVSHKQLTLAGFEAPFESSLDPGNRWVMLSQCIPWDGLAEGYYQRLSLDQGRPAKDARLVIGAVIIKHKLCLSDEETILQIQENPYLQYFVGLPCYRKEAVFAPSLFVEIRRRMGESVFQQFHRSIVAAVSSRSGRLTRMPMTTMSRRMAVRRLSELYRILRMNPNLPIRVN